MGLTRSLWWDRNRIMRSLFRRLLVALVLPAFLAACSGGGSRPKDAGADGMIADDAADQDGQGGLDLPVGQDTCQGIRACLWGCSTGNQTCIQGCIDKASPAAQALFLPLAACTVQYCPAGDFTCSCDQQCYAEGNCLTETEACVAGAAADLVCEELCH